MKVGIMMFPTRQPVHVAVVARQAEALWFDFLWVGIHPIMPVHSASPFPGSPDGQIPESYSGSSTPSSRSPGPRLSPPRSGSGPALRWYQSAIRCSWPKRLPRSTIFPTAAFSLALAPVGTKKRPRSWAAILRTAGPRRARPSRLCRPSGPMTRRNIMAPIMIFPWCVPSHGRCNALIRRSFSAAPPRRCFNAPWRMAMAGCPRAAPPRRSDRGARAQ